jgi:hypothetical protein
MKALRFGYVKFDSNTYPNKKEAVHIYETASFIFPTVFLNVEKSLISGKKLL